MFQQRSLVDQLPEAIGAHEDADQDEPDDRRDTEPRKDRDDQTRRTKDDERVGDCGGCEVA